MKKLLDTLPKDWIYQLVTLTLITTFTFYLFQYVEGNELAQKIWKDGDEALIYTFLGTQFAVKAIFYWLILMIVRKFLYGSIEKRFIQDVSREKSIGELKELSEFKRFLIELFGIPVKFGLIEKEELTNRIELTRQEIDDIRKNLLKWTCVAIHATITSILVWNLSAYYIIPLMLIFLLVVLAYWFVANYIFSNVRLINSVREELLEK